MKTSMPRYNFYISTLILPVEANDLECPLCANTVLIRQAGSVVTTRLP